MPMPGLRISGMHGCGMWILAFQRLSVAVRVAAIVISFAFVSFVDFLSGPLISTSLLYVSSVAFATLGFGFRVGVVVCIAAGSVWLAIDVNGALIEYSIWIHIWNALIRFGFFLLIALLLAALNDLFQAAARNALSCPLTKLANGRAFGERLEAERRRAQRSGRPLSLLYLDLDNFKAVNDRQGHGEGDRVLKSVAEAMAGACRATDLPARLGGDEFALILPETAGDGAEVFAQKIRAGVAMRMEAGDWPVTLSIGAVTFEGAPQDTASMLKHADTLMYQAKQAGKDSIVRRSIPASDPAPT